MHVQKRIIKTGKRVGICDVARPERGRRKSKFTGLRNLLSFYSKVVQD